MIVEAKKDWNAEPTSYPAKVKKKKMNCTITKGNSSEKNNKAEKAREKQKMWAIKAAADVRRVKQIVEE